VLSKSGSCGPPATRGVVPGRQLGSTQKQTTTAQCAHRRYQWDKMHFFALASSRKRSISPNNHFESQFTAGGAWK
jgi:hypothetical protein